MREEIFGPVLSVYVYDDDKFEEVRPSPYSVLYLSVLYLDTGAMRHRLPLRPHRQHIRPRPSRYPPHDAGAGVFGGV